MNGFVLGTAGHVDHGKTTLVHELTGIDTDRLPEEKARGISIELGFAWLDTPEGRVAFVDVPGHERFVRQMIAGAAGVDAVLLVVAADEGVMPQTREHLAICELLGIAIGAVVLTKVDLVDADWLGLVVDDVRAFTAGTFLEGRPIVSFARGDAARRSDVLGLVSALQVESRARADRTARDRHDRPFALPYDRAFAAPGFGTVVTGTSAAGAVGVGDEVVAWPDGVTLRVRGLEVHGERVAAAGPGLRVAVNVPGLEARALAGVLVHGDGPRPCSMIDATFRPVSGLPAPIDDGEKGLVHIGTERVEATLALFGPSSDRPGDREQPAQLRLARPIVFLPGSPYVFRGFRTWPGRPELGSTLGGGRALAPSARRQRASSDAVQLVRSLAADEPDVVAWIVQHGEAGVDGAALASALPWSRSGIARAVEAAIARDELVRLTSGRLVAVRALVHLERTIVGALDQAHVDQPERAGLPEHELWTRVRPDASIELIAAAIVRLVAQRLVERVERIGPRDGAGAEVIARRGYRPPAAARPEVLDQVVATFVAAGLAPPSPRELVGPDGESAAPIIDALVKAGRLVRVGPDLVFAAERLVELERVVRTWFEANTWLEAQDLKELAQVSRKFAIPLAEWLDRARVTVRVGDRRRLRG